LRHKARERGDSAAARGDDLKTLTILRHAKSGWDVQVERDFDRPINKRGARGAEIIGQWLKRQKLPVDRIVASPAVRVTETLDIFQPAAGLDAIEPHWDRRIYLASAATLIDVIRDTGHDADNLLISGHNPGLEDLILMLVPESDGDALRAKVEEKLPTSALARLELDIGDWHDLDTGMARFTDFIRPRDLDPALAPAMDED
jgi:phosphohistidine phosphatase